MNEVVLECIEVIMMIIIIIMITCICIVLFFSQKSCKVLTEPPKRNGDNNQMDQQINKTQ